MDMGIIKLVKCTHSPLTHLIWSQITFAAFGFHVQSWQYYIGM